MRILYNHISGQSQERLAALSDGIFAVAMTLLVLDLHTPIADAQARFSTPWLWTNQGLAKELALLGALADLIPHFLPYLMSFLTLGIFWVAQQTYLNYCTTSDRHLTWLQLAFLLIITLMPFSTGLLAQFITYRVALGIYWLHLSSWGACSSPVGVTHNAQDYSKRRPHRKFVRWQRNVFFVIKDFTRSRFFCASSIRILVSRF